jgi:hypothetical protein
MINRNRKPHNIRHAKAIAVQKRSVIVQKLDAALNFTMATCTTIAVAILVIRANPSVLPTIYVGDMTQINGNVLDAVMPPKPIIATIVSGPFSSGSRSCIFDVGYIEHSHGVATVYALPTDGVILSWSGTATSAGHWNCGTNVSLEISRKDYQNFLNSQLTNTDHIR